MDQIDRRQLMKLGGGAALAGVAMATGAGTLAGRAEAVTRPTIGLIGVERLWGSYSKYNKETYYDAKGTKRTRYVKVKVIRTKTMYEGTATKTLNYGGLCHWTGTAAPLTKGNCVLFGHRTSYGGPLRYTNRIKVGDRFTVQLTNGSAKTYVVVEAPKVISANDFGRAIRWGDRSRSNVTLVACTKTNLLPTSTKYRLLIRGTEV